MKKKHIFSIILFMVGICMALPHAWINEIHYDNAGTDRNEFVEVVVENPENHYLGDLVLYMYNGYDGMPYCLDSIDEFIPGDREGQFQFYTWHQRGIQNDMEGMVLVFKDTILDILAYEGTFTGVNAPADGEEFPDIGIHETGSGSDTNSIYLLGMPGSDWDIGISTPGGLNTGQVLSDVSTSVELIDFDADYCNNSVKITWITESENENSRFTLYKNGELLAFKNGSGTTNIPHEYEFIDNQIRFEKKLIYMLGSLSYDMRETLLDTIKLVLPFEHSFSVWAPFPNPSNPEFNVPVNVERAGHLKMEIIDLRGHTVRKIADRSISAGDHLFNVKTNDLASGQYLLKSTFNGSTENTRISILK